MVVPASLSDFSKKFSQNHIACVNCFYEDEALCVFQLCKLQFSVRSFQEFRTDTFSMSAWFIKDEVLWMIQFPLS